MNIAIYYFSATGNTKYGLSYLKKCLEESEHKCNLIAIEDKKHEVFDENKYDLYGFASPVFSGYFADIMTNYIKEKVNPKKTIPAFTVLCACNNLFNGFMGFHGAFMVSRDLMESKQLKVIAELGFYGEASHPAIRAIFNRFPTSHIFSRGRPNHKDEKTIRKFALSLPGIFETYKKGVVSKFKDSESARKRSRDIRHKVRDVLNYSLCVKRIDQELCNLCKLCQKKCPVDAITFTDKNEIQFNDEKCIHCERCVNLCPNDAMLMKAKIMPYKGPEKKVTIS